MRRVSTLLLIRHAQASFGAQDYDVLSPLGCEQATLLGAHLAEAGFRFDAVYAGPRRRHVGTAEHMARGAGAAGLPALRVLDELDEYPAWELVKRWMPALLAEDPSLAIAEDAPLPERARRMERAVRAMSDRWARGELVADGVETFAAFDTRVRGALDQVMAEQGRKRTVAVITSGGPISVTMRRALGLTEETTLRLMWAIRNTSFSEFRYREAELGLLGFNHVPHCSEPRLITHR